jgi:hypothetical protein
MVRVVSRSGAKGHALRGRFRWGGGPTLSPTINTRSRGGGGGRVYLFDLSRRPRRCQRKKGVGRQPGRSRGSGGALNAQPGTRTGGWVGV